MDLDALASQAIKPEDFMNLHFNKEWEQDVIYKIAQRLSSVPVEVDLIFGIFTQG